MTTANRQWLLHQRPVGMVGPEHFELVESPMPVPDVDAGQVITSSNPALPVGTLVQGLLNWQEYSVLDPTAPVPPQPLPEGVTPELALSIFGATSVTAYFGLLDVGQPQAGETVLVSGGAGATGSVVAQLARLKGCRVVAIAGGSEKCQWLLDACKVDAVIDYKKENLEQRIGELCPGGVNLFFDNVGGDTLEAAISHMADFGRIVLCGGIAGYNDETPQPGPNNLMILVTRRIRMQGFVVIDYLDRISEAMGALAEWVQAGELAWREDVQEGFENVPKTLQRLFDGRNLGKQLLKVADPD